MSFAVRFSPRFIRAESPKPLPSLAFALPLILLILWVSPITLSAQGGEEEAQPGSEPAPEANPEDRLQIFPKEILEPTTSVAEILRRLRAQRGQNAIIRRPGGQAICLAQGGAGGDCQVARRIAHMQPCLDADACPAADAWREQFGQPDIRLAKPKQAEPERTQIEEESGQR